MDHVLDISETQDTSNIAGQWSGAVFSEQVKPDPKQAMTFFAALFGRVDGGLLHFRAISEPARFLPNGKRDSQNLHYALDGRFGTTIEQFLEWCELDGRAAFVLPGLVKPGGTGKDAVLSMPAFLVDFDRDNPAANLAKLEAAIGPATIVVESGGKTELGAKLHAYWRLTESAAGSDIDVLCKAREVAAETFGGDTSFKQSAQIIRIPGSIHRKGEPALVNLRSVRPELVYDLDALANTIGVTVEPKAKSAVDWFDLNTASAQGPSGVDRALLETTREGAVDDITRFEAAGAALGYIIYLMRIGKLTEAEGWEMAKGWNVTMLVPPWPQERLRNDFDRLLRIELEAKGPMPAKDYRKPLTKKPFRLTDWTMHRYIGPAPEQRWLVEKVFPLGEPGIIAGDGGIGKSFLALDLCFRVAAGTPSQNPLLDFGRAEIFGGYVVEFGSAVFITAEESTAALHRRIVALDKHNRRESVADRLVVGSLRDLGGGQSLVGTKANGYPISEYAHELVQELRRREDLRVVILDPVSVFYSGEGNDRTGVQAFCNVLSFMASETGATVIGLHHMRKDSDDGSSGRKAILGSGGFVDGFRFAYTLRKPMKQAAAKEAAEYDLPEDHGELVLGSLVKANGSGCGGDQLYERQPDGILRQLPRRIDIAMAKRAGLRALLVEAVDWYAEWGQPFTRTGKQSGLHANRHCLPEPLRELASRHLEALAQEALDVSELQVASVGSEKRQNWLCKPGGSLAEGAVMGFRPGARPSWEARELH